VWVGRVNSRRDLGEILVKKGLISIIFEGIAHMTHEMVFQDSWLECLCGIMPYEHNEN